MFRVTQNTNRQRLSRLKGHAYNAFATGRHWAGMLDSAVHMGGRAYGVIKPLLDQSATGEKVNAAASSAHSTYDSLRPDVNSANARTKNLIGNLRKAVPEIGFIKKR